MAYEFKIVGELFEWLGPAPFYFIKVDPKSSAIIKKRAAVLSYGWGVVYIHGSISNRNGCIAIAILTKYSVGQNTNAKQDETILHIHETDVEYNRMVVYPTLHSKTIRKS